MDRSVRENLLAWLVLPILWLAAFAWTIRELLGLNIPNWWLPQLERLLLVGAIVQGVICLLDVSRQIRGLLYVVGIIVVGNLTSAWIFRASITRDGPDRFIRMALKQSVMYLVCCAVVLRWLWLLRYQRTAKGVTS